jgi:hypothetical protein
MRSSLRRILSVLTATAAGTGGLALLAPVDATAATDFCTSTAQPVYRTVNPGNTVQLLSLNQAESTGSAARGFTDDRGVLGYAASAPAPGLSPVTRLYNAKTADYVWMATPREVKNAESYGYVAQKVEFYAPTAASGCTVGVHRFLKGEHRRNAWDPAEMRKLAAAGWSDYGVSYYLKTSAAPASPPTTSPKPPAPAPGDDDNTFGIAVFPDTQAETTVKANTPFLNRVNWVAANKTSLDLRYVLHTGDMTNWGWLDAAQFTRAKAAMDVIRNAGIPYSLAVGNHDTRAVGWNGKAGSTGYGGSAYASNPECRPRLGAAACKSSLLIRNSDSFNATFPVSSLSNVGGVFEAGRIDNNWTTFTANNTRWLVLTIEFDPRAAAVEWARKVVASHPTYNVIIQTHHYLDSSGAISTSNNGYGSKSPAYLYDKIVSKYANVKLVFSGHVGRFASRSDTINGNTVVSFLGNDLGGPSYNPVRIVRINAVTGAVTSTVHDPIRGDTAGTTAHTIRIIH